MFLLANINVLQNKKNLEKLLFNEILLGNIRKHLSLLIYQIKALIFLKIN